MILLRELFEAKPKTTDFSAISNETGKLVYFSTKDTMDAAVKAGTHAKPKTDKKQDYFDKIQQYLKTKDLSRTKEEDKSLIKSISIPNKS